jgi:CheY-like chemotaxis protein
MEGEISVVSEPGKGSEFFFSAVFGLGEMPLRRIPEPAPDLRGMRVLVVDDSPLACDIFRNQLSALSYNVTVAFSGEEGVRKVMQEAETKPYDLVIVDWIMPGMDGFETARRIREIPGLSPLPKIIMATAYGCEDAAQLARSGGLDGYLTKPSNLSVLFDVIMCAFGRESSDYRRSSREKGVMAGLEQIRGASVLLVEDNEYNQLVASELLKSIGLLVTIAENGRQALDKLNARPFDVVLMDIQMPVMDGYEAARLIRSDATFNSLPIIAMTAHAMVSDRDKCLSAGMNDYVSKPIDPDALFSVLVTWIKPGGVKIVSEYTPRPAGESDGEIHLPNSLPGIFVGSGLRMCNDNKKLYRDLLVRFKNERQTTADEIRKALMAGDSVAAGRIAHTMKSVAGTLGAKQLSESAELLEKAIRSEDSGALDMRLAEFESCLRQMVDGLCAAFPEREGGDRRSRGTGRAAAVIDRGLLGQALGKMWVLLKSDIGQAMTQLESLREQLPEGPALDLFGRIERQMGEFDIDGAQESLRELAGVLDMPEGEL